MEVRALANPAAATVVVLLVAACSAALSLTEYAEGLEAAGAEASIRFDAVVVTLNAPDATLPEVRAAVREAAVIGNELHAALEALDPPDELDDLHAALLDSHSDVVTAQEDWAASADAAQSVAELLQSPEAQAAQSANEAALVACGRIQAAFDATTQREVFADVPWLPSELAESIEVATGCPQEI